MEHLLSRLEADSRPVSRRIVNLLLNSFFPTSQPEDVWCERCVTLIQMNPAAARKFYQYAYEFTAPTNIGKVQNILSFWNYWYDAMERLFASCFCNSGTLLLDFLGIEYNISL